MGEQQPEIGGRIDVMAARERFGSRQTCGFGSLSTKPRDRGELRKRVRNPGHWLFRRAEEDRRRAANLSTPPAPE